MSGRDHTTDGLIAAIERRAAVQSNPGHIDPEMLLAWSDDELELWIVPMILGLNADHFKVFQQLLTTTADEYDIPAAAMNRTLQNVSYRDPNTGDESSLHYVDYDVELECTWPRNRQAYYFRGDKLVLFPKPESGKTMRLYYYRLPNKLVETDAACQVLEINGLDLTCSAVPSTITVSTPVSVVQGSPGFGLRFESLIPDSVASPIVSLPDVTGIQVGDWIALEGESPIVQLPVETHKILAQAAAVKVHEYLGDREAMRMAQAKLEEVANAYRMSYPNRSEQGPKRLISRNRIVDRYTGRGQRSFRRD